MLVERRPYNDQNKDQTDQKVDQRKRGKKKRTEWKEQKTINNETKTELNCQRVIELRVFLSCLLCILSLKIELCMDHQNGCNHVEILTFTVILEFCSTVHKRIYFIEFISELY